MNALQVFTYTDHPVRVIDVNGAPFFVGKDVAAMKRMSKLYIAYGSNLSVEQMAHRCPDAEVAGMAAIKDWKQVFRGCSTIEPAEGRVVPVLIWEISERDERNLDCYEGWPSYYRKEDMKVTMTDLDGKNPREVTAMVYLMNDGHPIQTPWKNYYDTLKEGYTRFGFNTYLLERAFEDAMEVEIR